MRTNPEALEAAIVFRVYAVAGVIGGVAAFAVAILAARPPAIVSAGSFAAIGLTGSLTWALASYAAALSRVPDPAARAAGLKEFAIAHFVIAAFLMTAAQSMSTFRSSRGRRRRRFLRVRSRPFSGSRRKRWHTSAGTRALKRGIVAMDDLSGA